MESDSLIQPEEEQLYVIPSERRFQDTLFLYLYLVCSITFLVSGFQHLKQPSFDHYELLFVISSISTALSLFWLFVITRLSKLIYLTALLVPLFTIGISIYACFTPMIEFALVKSATVISILLSLFSMLKIVKNKHKFELISRLYSMTTIVLSEHPSLLLLSLILSLVHVGFSVLWIYMFGHLLTNFDFETKCWIVFYLVYYFWTSAILKNTEKAVVGSIVGQWYFESHEEDEDDWDIVPKQNTFYHLKFVGSRSFGSISIASLLLGSLHTIDFILKKVYTTRLSRNRFMKFLFSTLKSVCEKYTGYVVTFIGITGSSFSQSASNVTKLFRRHLIFGLATSFIAKLISFMGKFLVSSGTVLIVFSVYGYRQDMGYQSIFIIGSVIPYYILNICTHAWESTYFNLIRLDACFVCFVIGKETGIQSEMDTVFESCLK